MVEGEGSAERFDRERAFHDKKYSQSGTSPRHYSVSPTYHIFRRMLDRMGPLEGKTVLEIGCGTGWITCELASAGARVIACDISSEAVRTTKQLLHDKGLAQKCEVFIGAVEEIGLPEQSVDLTLGFAILHHLDLDDALPKIHALIRNDGRLLAAEPLATNPLINAYRLLTPQFRTDDEHPLVLEDFYRRFSRYWSIEHEEYYLLASGLLALAYVPGGRRLYAYLAPRVHGLDRAVLRRWPDLGKFAWYTILDMRRQA